MFEFQIVLLLLGTYGISLGVGLPYADLADHSNYQNPESQQQAISYELPGSANLDEKALPLAKLYANEFDSLPGTKNLAERSQLPRDLPGTKNLAEKRIPEVVLKTLYEKSS